MMDRENIAARALDALEPEERRRFDAGADEALRAELADMQATAAALSEAVAVAPPADLRARIFEQVAATEQVTVDQAPVALSPAEAADADASVEAEPALVGGGTTLAGPAELSARRRWFQRPGQLLVAAAAAVVLLVGGVAIGQSIRTPDPVSALVHASDVQTQTASLADGTRATLISSLEQGEVAFVFEGLAGLEDEQVYEAWFMRDGEPVAAGIFDGGEGSVVHMLDGDLTEGDMVAITVEPAGGSEQPTSEPILLMQA